MSDHGESDIRDNRAFQVGLSHFAFVTNELTNITQRLMAAGFVGVQGDGAAGVRNNTYFIDSDGYEIELVEYLTADIGQKNDY